MTGRMFSRHRAGLQAALLLLVGWLGWAWLPLGGELCIIYTGSSRGLMTSSLLAQGVPLLRVAGRSVPRQVGMDEAAARVAAMRQDVIDHGGVPVLLDTGDSLLGSDLLSAWFHGEPAARLLAELHYDAMLPGDKEWSLGSSALANLGKGTGLTFLCASAGAPCVNRLERQWNGQRVAIYGWYEPPVSPRAPSSRRSFRGVMLQTDRAALRDAIARDPADLVILVAAVDRVAGLAAEVPRARIIIPARQSGCEDLRAARVEGGVVIAPWVDGRRRLGRISVTRTLRGLRIDAAALDYPQLRPASDSAVFQKVFEPFDAQLQTRLGPAYATVPEVLSGCLPAAMLHPMGGFEPSAPGQWLCELMMDRCRADCAILNHRALRGSMPRLPGVEAEVLQALPFGNNVVVLELRGQALTSLMKRNVLENRRYLQVAGVQVSYRKSAAPGGGDAAISIGGLPLDPTRTYRVATIDYLADGARGQEPILRAAPRLVDTGICLNHLVRDAFWDRFWIEPSRQWIHREGEGKEPTAALRGVDPAEFPEQALASDDCLDRARAHLALGSYGSAAAALEEACRTRPGDAACWVALGWAAFADGRPARALTAWRRARPLLGEADAARLDSVLELIPR